MRVAVVSSLLVLFACGGAAKPAQTESGDTSSLDSKGSESGGGSASSASSSSGETASAPASSSAPSSAPSSATGPGASGGQAAPAAGPASLHPVPAATGSIDGKPFAPKLAQISGKMQKDGRVAVVLHEGSDCAAQPGDASMTLMVTWKDGYKVDVGSLKRAKGGNLGEAAFVRMDGKKKNVSSTFKPTGLVTIVSAPTDKDAVGKMKIDLQSGDYMLAGDLDVKLCAAAK